MRSGSGAAGQAVPRRLIVAAHVRLPSPMAHAHQIIQMCEAFANEGVPVTLLSASPRGGLPAGGLWGWYGVEPNFSIEPLPCLDWMPEPEAPASGPDRLWRWLTWNLRLLSYTRALLRRLRGEPQALVLSRDSLPLWVLAVRWPRRARRFFYEAHTWPATGVGRALRRGLARRVGGTIVVTEALRQRYLRLGFEPARLLVARDGVRANRFEIEGDRAAWRARLGWPAEAFIVGYAGRFQTLGMGKGLHLLAEAVGRLAREMGPAPVRLALVGGLGREVEDLRAALGDRLPPGTLIDAAWVPPAQLPGYLSAFDVCTLPLPWTDHFAYAASPLKLFEYMASGTPIVASDLPALAEVLRTEENALLVPPGDPAAWLAALRRLRDERGLGEGLARHARQDAGEYTWQARARKILEMMSGMDGRQAS